MAESLTTRVAQLEAEVTALQAAVKDRFGGVVNEGVSAMAFELLNSDGEPVAELNTTEDGDPCFTLFDKDHEARFIVRLVDGRPELTLTLNADRSGYGAALLFIGRDGAPNLVLHGPSGDIVNHIRMGFSKAFEYPCRPYLEMEGANGRVELGHMPEMLGHANPI